ncbi:MAG: toll/interleukin-1 receptor domain-containing protein [Butyrivibrio sp.]|nr:toll/interleukin-1 receptor domain-containing protein [Acetatifactor muris]MCM1557969.1 toll/interleukin-1 receptor domain-containing protein [Butyrivibrio sp.]
MIFISHSSNDAATAAEICDLLERNRIKCFIAPRDIRSGREYAEEIVNGIDASRAMVLLMSGAANASPHVLREVERAVSKSIPVLVYKLEDVELSKSLEYFLMTHQWINQENKGDFSQILTAVIALEQETEAKEEEKEGRRSVPAKTKQTGRAKRVCVACGVFAAAVITVCLCLGAAGVPPFGSPAAAESYPVQVGDTLVFGSYNSEPIQWRVLRLEEQDGRQTAVLVSRYILTMKAFDAAESGKYNHDETGDYISMESEADFDMELQAYVRGDSSWRKSNIRTWLNAETELVSYEGQAPVSSAMSELHNGYQNEPGFLYHFSAEEIKILVERECHTPGNALEEGEIVTRDRVFLLSEAELAWFDQAGISKLAEPTQAALEQDMSQWYEISVSECGLKEYAWWLRTPVEGYSSKAYLVENGYGLENDEISNNLKKANVGLEGFGIRPAITIDLESYFKYQMP